MAPLQSRIPELTLAGDENDTSTIYMYLSNKHVHFPVPWDPPHLNENNFARPMLDEKGEPYRARSVI